MSAPESEFLELVRRSGVADEARLAAYSNGAHPPTDTGKLAERMIQDGVLTHFQAERLRQGKWRGFTLGGKYRLLEQLGVGGMGAVFLSLHLRMGTLVALKMLASERIGGPATLERFEREARAAANLNHANLVRAFDIDEGDGVHYLVMDYIHGVTLQKVGEGGRLDPGHAAEYTRQAALGLAAAHAAGLIHRDVKPGNLLLDALGAVKVVDLGLARYFRDRADRLTDEQSKDSILGTADYLAPEQALNSTAVDGRADIYSLGATLYYLLAGRAPFAEGTVGEKLIAHQVRMPPPLGRNDIPPGMEADLNRMLAKDPRDRFQSATEVADAMANWVSKPVPPPSEADLPELCPAVRAMMPRPTPSVQLDQVATPPLRRVSRPRRRWFWAGIAVSALVAIAALATWGNGLLFPAYIPPTVVDRSKVPNPFPGVDGEKVVSADQAFGMVGQRRTVRVPVKAASRNSETGAIYLSSRKDVTEPNRFTVVIGPSVSERLRAVGVKNPYDDFLNEQIEVTGVIVYLDNTPGHPAIEVTEPGQLRKVEPH